MSITRRNALTGATAAVAVAGVPMAALGKQTDPVAVLVRKSEAYEEWLETMAGTVPEEEFNALCEVGSNMQREICDTPATSIEAIRGKAQIAWENSVVTIDELRNGPPEDSAPLDPIRFIWSALKDLERLAKTA